MFQGPDVLARRVLSDPECLKYVSELFAMAPAYTRKVPASPSGKYHSEFDQGEGGLWRHLEATMLVALTLFPSRPDFTRRERDIILSALAVHDLCKCGLEDEGSKTVFNHAALVETLLPPRNETEKAIIECVRTHMGKWAPADVRPQTEMQKFVHMCDYIASRKTFNILDIVPDWQPVVKTKEGVA